MEAKTSRKGLAVAIAVIVIALAGIAVYAALGNQQTAPNSSQNQSDTTTGSKDPASEAAPTPSDRVAITFTDSGFEPSTVTVKKGTIITVTNRSKRDVQFSSNEHPAHRDNTEMNMKTLAPGESESYTATVVGKWGFHDHLDEEKTGTVTVTE